MKFFLGGVGREPGEVVPTKNDGVVGAGDAIMPARLASSVLGNSPPEFDPGHDLTVSGLANRRSYFGVGYGALG